MPREKRGEGLVIHYRTAEGREVATHAFTPDEAFCRVGATVALTDKSTGRAVLVRLVAFDAGSNVLTVENCEVPQITLDASE